MTSGGADVNCFVGKRKDGHDAVPRALSQYLRRAAASSHNHGVAGVTPQGSVKNSV
jgi:hypothetical protein